MEFKKYYLKEFNFHDGESFVTFNIVDINCNGEQPTITVAVTKQGGISVKEYDLLRDLQGNLYFEYGPEYKEIAIDDFEEIDE